MEKTSELKVFITKSDPSCVECGEQLGRGAWITLVENPTGIPRDKEALCLSCADLDHLVFLASGDAALSRRARKHSQLSAVVLEWSRARKQYERQGLLVEQQALEQAEVECLADGEARGRRREREAARREELDREYVQDFGARVRELFPLCPPERAEVIAEHACQKYSGRVGRSAAAKSLDESAVRLAVIAHIRHAETEYDTLLARGYERGEARGRVEREIARILVQWGVSG
jgi:hypothetical protein